MNQREIALVCRFHQELSQYPAMKETDSVTSGLQLSAVVHVV